MGETFDFFPRKLFGSRAGRIATRGSQRCICAVLNSQLLLVGCFRQFLPFKRSQIDALSQGALLPWHRALVFALQRRACLRGVLVKPSWLVQRSAQRASGCKKARGAWARGSRGKK